MDMLHKYKRTTLTKAILMSLSLCNPLLAHAAAPNPDDVPVLSTLVSEFEDYEDISDYAQKAVVRLELLGVYGNDSVLSPQAFADKAFLRRLLGTLDDLGEGMVTYNEAEALISEYLLTTGSGSESIVSFDGFLSKKNYAPYDYITREDLSYLVAHARESLLLQNGLPIHNPAIASPGPLLGPTVFQSGSDENGAVYDGSTVSLFHRGKNSLNTTFVDSPVLTLQVHPEVFKSVSAGGIEVDALQDLAAQLEVELHDGSIHRTPLTSLVPFSIHGADGKAGVIRIEDGLLVLADDLLGYVERFSLNGHEVDVEETISGIHEQAYYNGETTSEEIVSVVVDELRSKGFSLQDRRLMAHNMILAKTALQQASLSPLSSPFNTIAGPGSAVRNFKDGHLFSMYQFVEELRLMAETGQTNALQEVLNGQESQQNLLTGTKILTAATLLPHITALSNAPFLPNEALSSRVKKSGALLPSEPVVFQFDRLKRAAYIILDEALSEGSAQHLVTKGEIVRRTDAQSQAFALSADNFEAVPLHANQSPLVDAIYDYTQAYEELVRLISGRDFSGSLQDLNEQDLEQLNTAFSSPVLSEEMANVKIGNLEFKMDMLATPSHVQETFAPDNDLTQLRRVEGFGLDTALEPFPQRLVEYVCNGSVIDEAGEVIDQAKIVPEEQGDLVNDLSESPSQSCLSATAGPRYRQLLFVDNFQLPPFGPSAKFISTQGIEIINRVLFTPVNSDLQIKDIRLSYRLTEPEFNSAPVASIQGPEKVIGGEIVNLDAGLSSDADGDALQFLWKIKSGDGNIIGSNTDAEVQINTEGTEKLVVELQVSDGIANSSSVEKEISLDESYGESGGGGATGLGLLLLFLIGALKGVKSRFRAAGPALYRSSGN
jgi:hypothetical protein